jgi:Ser-tRNA(Ala) deacylase AlaX
MGEAALDELEVEALRGGVSTAAAEEGEEVGVRVQWRRRARRRRLRRREAVGEEVA